MRRAPPLAEVARATQRLAVLLGAGIAPGAAWRFVAGITADGVGSGERRKGAANADESVAGAVARSPEGDSIAEAIGRASNGLPVAERRAWLGLAAAWQVATEAGSPLASTLRDYADSLRSLADAERDIEVALASPRATARVVVALPLIGVIFGALMGFGTIEVLVTTPLGWGCLAVGGALLLAARMWNTRLVGSARPIDTTPGMECDLLAIAVGGGASLERARAAVDAAIARFGLDIGDRSRAEAAARLSQSAGVPVAELLRAEAQEARRDARAEAQRRAAALSVRLMIPLGLCVLPAFLVLGVAPLVAAVLSSTLGGFVG